MNLNDNSYIHLYSSCKLVKGKKRGTITDLQRSRVELVPNELIDIVIQFNGRKISDIKTSRYSIDDIKIIEEYFQFLIEKEIIFLSKEKTSFYTSNEIYETPKQIISAILDVDKNSTYKLSEAIKKIEMLGCDNVQIRLYDYKVNPKKLGKIVSVFNNTSFRYVEFLLQYEPKFISDFQKIFKQNNRVYLVYFHSYKGQDKIEDVDSIKYIYTSEKIVSSDFCGYILPFYFDISPITYYIGEQYNTCLYKKIAVDVEGNVKNCPSMKNNFGHIGITNLNEIITSSDFTKYWNITKDKISICKSCEFRKICTDCRAYLNENELYEKPKRCDYEPSQPNW